MCFFLVSRPGSIAFVAANYLALMIRLHSLMQVKGLAFNQLSPNLLASGGADGDIIIWDVANPRKPTAFPPLKVSYKTI